MRTKLAILATMAALGLAPLAFAYGFGGGHGGGFGGGHFGGFGGGRIRGTTVGVGVIRRTILRMAPRTAITTAAITPVEITKMDMQTVQELSNCNADFHGPGITMVKSMESWALRRGEQFARTSVTVALEIPAHQRSSNNFFQ